MNSQYEQTDELLERDDPGIYLLVSAVIRSAFLDLSSIDGGRAETARRWFESPECRPPSQCGGLAFRWLCTEFDVDPDSLFSRLNSERIKKHINHPGMRANRKVK